jgi:hypothetical protein
LRLRISPHHTMATHMLGDATPPADFLFDSVIGAPPEANEHLFGTSLPYVPDAFAPTFEGPSAIDFLSSDSTLPITADVEVMLQQQQALALQVLADLGDDSTGTSPAGSGSFAEDLDMLGMSNECHDDSDDDDEDDDRSSPCSSSSDSAHRTPPPAPRQGARAGLGTMQHAAGAPHVPGTSSSRHASPREFMNTLSAEERMGVMEKMPSEGLGGLNLDSPMDKLTERKLKKLRRQVRNKISAQDSRRRRKMQHTELESRAEDYMRMNRQLQHRVRVCLSVCVCACQYRPRASCVAHHVVS